MNRILVLNENGLERNIMGEILSSGLRTAEIALAAAAEQALEQLREGTVDLFIVDIPYFDLPRCNLVSEAKQCAPDTPILVTSVGRREDIAAHIWRLGVQDYLLKPYRPAWLLAAANVLMRGSSEGRCGREEKRRERYLRLLSEHMREFQYKKCTDAAKEYLDSLYADTDNIGVIRADVVAFAEGLAQLGEPLGPSAQWKLSGSLEHFRARFDLQGRKYETYVVFEKMLDILFETIEESKCYEVGDAQRILNYIDRKIKSGIGLDEAAEYASMSSCYFSKFFKKITGMNFITYVTDRKIEAAQKMLVDTDMPVINIAYELSYSETNYFSKAFKKKVGVTPTEYREGRLMVELKEHAG